ncbi:MAG: ATP-binding protein [Bacteroidia bacterium]
MKLSNIEALELTFQFEAIFEAFPDILFKLSRDGKILSCKAGKPSLKYLDPEKYVGQQIKDILPSLCMDTFKTSVAKLNSVGDIACFEFPFERGDKMHWFEARLVPFYKKQVLAILRDVTEKKQMEHRLQREISKTLEGKEMIKAISEAISAFVPDPKTLTEEQPNDIEILRSKIAEYNALNDKLNYEINLRRGMESTLKMHLEELRKRNKELEHFRYLATNDFQDPLRHITSFAKILASKYQSQLDSEAFEMLEFMVEGGKQMQEIVTHLSDYTKLDTDHHVQEALHIEDKVMIAKKRLAAKMAQKNAHVFFDELPVIHGNREQIITLFEYLIDNAIKFSRENVQPEIQVGVQEYPAYYQFYVKDNGIGFNMDFHERIFMLFQRLHPHSAFSGAGIGLAFCKKIVEQHGGEMWAESELGQGSTFFFTLPKLPVN